MVRFAGIALINATRFLKDFVLIPTCHDGSYPIVIIMIMVLDYDYRLWLWL